MNRRFYDEEPAIRQAVDMLLLFPPDIQNVIATGFSLIAEQECDAAEQLRNFRSLGTEKVLALYKSKQKCRKYDASPVIHRAINYLMIVSRDNRLFLARKVMELTGYVRDYLMLCKDYHKQPREETVRDISDRYVQYGPRQARQMVDDVKSQFARQLQSKSGATDPISPMREEIEHADAGMRINIHKDLNP